MRAGPSSGDARDRPNAPPGPMAWNPGVPSFWVLPVHARPCLAFADVRDSPSCEKVSVDPPGVLLQRMSRLRHSVMTDSDSSDDASRVRKSWIDSFLEQPASDWFCRVPAAFALDGFNTFGLRIDQQHAKSAFSLLTSAVHVSEDSDSYDSDSEEAIEKCTEVMFGLVHARYIYTPEGLADMNKKYQQGVFGTCPRYYCSDQHLLPAGLTDRPNVDTVKLYCPKCRQMYEADEQHRNLDGAFFTRSFPHYFLMELKELNASPSITRHPSRDLNLSESQSVGRSGK